MKFIIIISTITLCWLISDMMPLQKDFSPREFGLVLLACLQVGNIAIAYMEDK